MTREVVKAAAAVGLSVHDHVILGRGKHASFKSLGLSCSKAIASRIDAMRAMRFRAMALATP